MWTKYSMLTEIIISKAYGTQKGTPTFLILSLINPILVSTPIYLRIILILSSHLRRGLTGGPFSVWLPVISLRDPVFFHSGWYTLHLIFIYLIPSNLKFKINHPVYVNKRYKLWSSSWSPLRFSFSSSLGPNILKPKINFH